MFTFGVYVPSYKRSHQILTANLIPQSKYVVRKSEEAKYISSGVNVVSVEDDLIDSIPKVENWIIENTPEDVICMVDDDIKSFVYRIEENESITDENVLYDELLRLAQILVDLDIGYLSTPSDMNPKFYSAEFKFCGVTGPLRIINKEKCSSRFNEIPFLNDVDFELQELLKNRVILIPNYFCADAFLDTNEGGSNDAKTLKQYYVANDEMKNKWGKYYEKASNGSVGRIRVSR